MSSIYFDKKILMKPEDEKQETNNWGGFGYPYIVPTVYLYGCGEEYFPQYAFGWGDDSVVLVRGNKVKKYTCTKYTELLAKDEGGKTVWIDGRDAPYADCWGGTYLNKYRNAEEYTIEEYDLEKFEKKKYKVVLEETEKISASDFDDLKDFVDLKTSRNPDEEKCIDAVHETISNDGPAF